jgi:multidrug efflux pump subunit AcrA (membrane-fusion protein)
MRAFSQVLAGVGIVVAGAILLARGSQAGPQAPDKGEKPVVAPAQAGCTCACCASKEQARAALLDVKGEDIYCRIDGTVRIRSLVPDGSVVKEGAVIVELDTSELSRKLADQRIAVQKAESNLKTAQLAFENAKLNLQEFQMDTLTEDDLQSRISLTQSLLEIAKDMQDYCQAE